MMLILHDVLSAYRSIMLHW